MSNEEIIGIINYVNSLSFSEFELEIKDLKLKIKRAGVAVSTDTSSVATASNVPIVETMESTVDLPSVMSPMTGTYYQASSPGGAPFADVGNSVKEGDTLCIVEAMKMMIEVKAEFDGVVKKINGVDGEPVTEGEALFVFEGD